MFARLTQDSFSEGVVYPGRALVALGLALMLAALLSSL